MIEPGNYEATVLSHAISETKNGDPQATVTFSVKTKSGPQQIKWFGSFKEKAQPHTIKALLVCGLKGTNPAGPLQIGKEVLLVIDEEAGEDGKMRTKVRWVNQIGGGVRNAMPQDLAKAKLSSLEGAVMAARNDLGIGDSDDIPF